MKREMFEIMNMLETGSQKYNKKIVLNEIDRLIKYDYSEKHQKFIASYILEKLSQGPKTRFSVYLILYVIINIFVIAVIINPDYFDLYYGNNLISFIGIIIIFTFIFFISFLIEINTLRKIKKNYNRFLTLLNEE
jgi:hypothetical protein